MAEPAVMKPRFDAVKFRELILYFAEKCEGDTAFGATKLNKLLWISDFLHYARTGEPLTGATYFKLPHGPAPKQLIPVTKEMEGRELVFKQVDRFGKTQVRVVPLRSPKLDVFSAEEIATADEAIRMMWDANASQLSRWTHEFRGWRLAEPKGAIPYETFFLSEETLPAELVEHAREVATTNKAWSNS